MNTREKLRAVLILAGLFSMVPTITHAQLPFRPPTSSVLETTTHSNLLQQYPVWPGLSNNITEIKNYLSGGSPCAMRLSTATETAMSRQIAARQVKQHGAANTNLHFHINFSAKQFVVETLRCPPGSYSLDAWNPVPAKAKMRSDGFFDDKYYVMMPGGVLSQMEFGSLDAFKTACIANMQNDRPETQNLLMEQAGVDFRQYARFQNLGHDGVVPDSFVFTGDDFVCDGVRGDHMTGSIHTNEAGLVDMISYHASEHYGPRVFLLFYDTFFTHGAWYPSHILDTIKSGGSCAVTQIHTIYNVYSAPGGELSIPRTAVAFYDINPSSQSGSAGNIAGDNGTNWLRQIDPLSNPVNGNGTNLTVRFEWTSNMVYEIRGTQIVASPSLLERDSGGGAKKSRHLLSALFIASSIALLAVVLFLSRRKQIKQHQT